MQQVLEETEVGFIRSPGDVARLQIVDWNRYTRHWKTPMRAIDVVGSWVVGFRYSVLAVDLWKSPQRNDFPQWNHAGGESHRSLVRLFWNFFKQTCQGELCFHDKPDISGYLYNPKLTPDERPFVGDIGKVSPVTFLDAVHGMPGPGLWISVLDESTLVFLEAPPAIANEGVILE